MNTLQLQTTLESGLDGQGAAAASLGILLHMSIFRTNFPAEDYMYTLLGLHVLSLLVTAYAYWVIAQFSLWYTIMRVGYLSFSFNVGLLLSISVYRLFFHRLKKFPGPLGLKLTRFYDAYLAAKDVQYHVEIGKLHDQYGDFVRTGPREVSIVRKSAVSLIFGPQSKCTKSTWYAQVSTDPKSCSIHHTRDIDDHRKRRKAWDRGLSVKALGTYESRIKTKVDLLSAQIGAHLDQNFDATAWSMFLSFDIMGEVGFGKDFGNLTTGVEHPAIGGIHDSMTVAGVMGHIPWLLNLLGQLPGATSGYTGFFKWCADEIERKKKIWDANEYPEDIVSWLLKAYKEKDISAPPSEEALHQDSRVLVVAGSETTATTLASILFYLAKNPAVLAKLQKYLDEAMPDGPGDWRYGRVREITFIDDIINETLRLRPALMTGGYRVTPAEGIQVDEIYIPGDVNVFVPTQVIQTHNRYYEDAKQFIPERWTEKREGKGADGAPFFPFAFGPYSCPGKSLAMTSLRISMSTLAQQYDITFAPGETGEIFEKSARDIFTTALPPLQLQFRKRA